MVAYARYQVVDLPMGVGRNEAGRRVSDGRAGHLCFGPYLTLGPGRYTAGFYIRRDVAAEEGEIEIDICNEQGRRVFGSRILPVKELFSSITGLVHVDFALDETERGCELRLRVPAHTQVEISEAVLFRRDLSGRRNG